ncbi:MAG: helix-turn-helix domain-containing protein [Acutalibacteraceae bacterium]|jgi:AraC-like DNA-binding protein/quercetin dioxygenase-like cupin family protein
MADTSKTFILPTTGGALVKTVVVTMDPGQYRPLHSHLTLEISMIVAGQGLYEIDGQRCPVKTGDIVLFNNNHIHALHNTGDGPIVNLALEFEPRFLWDTPMQSGGADWLDVFFHAKPGFSHRLDRDNPAFGGIQRQFGDLQAAMENDSPYREAVVYARLAGMLADMLQHYDFVQTPSAKAVRRHADMDRVLQYIHTNYARPITLEEMAQLLYINKNYFSQIFRDSNGIGPKEYLIKVRVAAAAQKLRESDAEVAEIAHACGFNSLSNFYAAFGRVIGKSPVEYRAHPLD